HVSAVDVLDRTFSEIGTYDDLVLVRDIPFYSHCEHHIMPFVGRAHVAYLPVQRVVGLSKIARLIDVYARRMQTQEHLNSQIITAIDEVLKPRGVAVMLEAEHTCMSLRGVEKPGSKTITSQFTGLFRDDPAEQARFITLVRSSPRGRRARSSTRGGIGLNGHALASAARAESSVESSREECRVRNLDLRAPRHDRAGRGRPAVRAQVRRRRPDHLCGH